MVMRMPAEVHASARQRGFTLVEVMVAFFVLAIGLLGMAGLLSQSIRGNQSALYRSQAVMLASDMADRIRANTAVDYVDVVAAGSDCVRDMVAPGVTACDSQVMAANDVSEWTESLATMLPGGVGVICADDTPFDGDSDADDGCEGGALLVIKVWWDANPRDGAITATDPRTVLVVR